MIVAAGYCLVLLGALLLYLAAPNQRLPRRALGISGALALAIGLALVLTAAGPATSVYIAFTLAISVWTLVPLAVAWWRRPQEHEA